jgi:hypothetical protein
MAKEKYLVRCYYTYYGMVEVEAESVEEASEIGYELCDKMGTDELDFVGYTDMEVQDETGFIHEIRD